MMNRSGRVYAWKDSARLTGAVVVSLIAFLFFRVLNIVIFGLAWVSPERVAWAFQRDSLVDLFAGLTFLISAGLALAWVYRVNGNGHVLKPDMTYDPWAATISFVVPFANFFVPYLALAETWDASAQASPKAGRRGLLGFWWAASLLRYGLLIFVYLQQRVLEPGDDFLPLLVATILVNAAAFVSGLAFMGVVLTLSKMQTDSQRIAVFSDEPKKPLRTREVDPAEDTQPIKHEVETHTARVQDVVSRVSDQPGPIRIQRPPAA